MCQMDIAEASLSQQIQHEKFNKLKTACALRVLPQVLEERAEWDRTLVAFNNATMERAARLSQGLAAAEVPQPRVPWLVPLPSSSPRTPPGVFRALFFGIQVCLVICKSLSLCDMEKQSNGIIKIVIE
jgi:hypothetical protein